MLGQFLLHSKVGQLYVHINLPLFWISFPFRSPERCLEFPVLHSRFSLASYFKHRVAVTHTPIPISHAPSCRLGDHALFSAPVSPFPLFIKQTITSPFCRLDVLTKDELTTDDGFISGLTVLLHERTCPFHARAPLLCLLLCDVL